MTNDASPSLGRLLVGRGVITEEQLSTALRVQREKGGMLGEILTARGWVTPLSIAAAVAKQNAEMTEAEPASSPGRPGRKEDWKPLGTLLLEKGFISEVELRQALAVQRDEGGFLGEILVNHHWLAASDLVLALAAQLGLDFDVKRVAANGDDAFLPVERPEACFEVLENAGDEIRLLRKTDTFMEATDFVFDEVLWQREPGDLQIVRVDGGRREVAWSFKPGEAAAHTSEDMLSVFGYAVGQWEDKHQQAGSQGSSLAATG